MSRIMEPSTRSGGRQTTTAMRFAEVAVDAPTGYDRTFSYSVPESLDIVPGGLVRVPFGPRTLQGLVFELAATPQVPETRSISGTTGAGPLLSPQGLSLARWISRKYMSPLFDAVALMLPPGGRVRHRTFLEAPADTPGSGATLSRQQHRVVDYLRSRGRVEHDRLVAALGPGVRNSIGPLVARGVLTRTVAWAGPAVRPKLRPHLFLDDRWRGEALAWLPDGRTRAPRQAALIADLVQRDGPILSAEARREFGASPVKALTEKRWLGTRDIAIDRDPLAGLVLPTSPPVALTPRQRAIADRVGDALEDAAVGPREFLVQGVTGSGKTEVYLEAAARCLRLGKRAIVLVPEIALTHQTVERFASRFPGEVAVLHSGLTAGERFDQWWKVKGGQYGIVIGSRSAVFAPQPELGLIVIDEEHEWTYKQHDASPRYHARAVASELARDTGAVILAGSASPDLGSYLRGLRKEVRLETMPQRVRPGTPAQADGTAMSDGEGHRPNESDFDIATVRRGEANGPLSNSPPLRQGRGGLNSTAGTGSLPRVEIVDMRRELREGNRGIFSRLLDAGMSECLETGHQMILFLNRRGSASYVQCRSCGESLRCRACDVPLTYHRSAGLVLCHYCGYKRRPPGKCPKCLSYKLSYYGVGTQSVVDEVTTRFPEAAVLRWDRDAAKGLRAGQELLEKFRSHEAQVLVGTQMIAKGLHFPEVTLVGVISADVGLNIPDYRAGERAFQVLCQVAGRAGRGSAPGSVVIQTYQPENYAIRAAAAQDYQAFYTKEMAYRREHSNPPYSKLIRLLYAHTNRATSEREASKLGATLKERREAWGYSEVDVLGPAPAYPPRLRGRFRWHIVLRGADPRMLLDRIAVPAGWTVDIDPVILT